MADTVLVVKEKSLCAAIRLSMNRMNIIKWRLRNGRILDSAMLQFMRFRRVLQRWERD